MPLKIGFAKVKITPPMGMPMRGQLFPYHAKGVESDLYANAMCIGDGRNEVLLVSCDVAGISNEMATRICNSIEQNIDVPASNIIVCATHTHSGPATSEIEGNDLVNKYCAKLEEGIVEALLQAHENTTRGKLTLAFGELPDYGFQRRFIMSDRTIQTHPLKLDPHIVKPEGPDSKDLFTFCAFDKKGNPMGAAINFTCHATVMERDNELISVDYPGKVCDFVNEKLGEGTVSLFLQGPCGNICQVNPLDDSNKEVGLEWTKVMGKAIGGKAVELMNEESTDGTGPLRAVARNIEIPRRKIDPILAEWALNYKDVAAEVPELSYYGTEFYNDIEVPLYSLSNLFETPWWANTYTRNVKRQLKNEVTASEITLKVFAQDNWALVSLPGEFFIEWGNAIREKSPFKNTIVVAYANGSNGYFPTQKAFNNGGGYETNVGTARFAPEAGEMVVDAAISMLMEVHNH
ncbi:neutral/alkaline non-lysosomal ceramidase N-terminal domain-containing protein [Bacteroidota bacterium]